MPLVIESNESTLRDGCWAGCLRELRSRNPTGKIYRMYIPQFEPLRTGTPIGDSSYPRSFLQVCILSVFGGRAKLFNFI